VFQVTERFYQLGTARQKVLVKPKRLEAAQTVEQAVRRALTMVLPPSPEILQAQQQAVTRSTLNDDRRGKRREFALVESIGFLRIGAAKVADLGQRSTSEQTNGSVDQLIVKALSQRPDQWQSWRTFTRRRMGFASSR